MSSFSNIEQRVLLGIVFFVGLLLLLGWVMINEEGRMQAFLVQQDARSIERGATLYQNNCSTCHGVQGEGVPSFAPALNNPRLFNGERMGDLEWTGSLDDYVRDAIAGGRPNSGIYWNGNVMPTWGDEFGGPLRPDQVQNVADYVMNWQTTALDPDNPPTVNEDFRLPGAAGATAATLDADAAGSDVDTILLDLEGRDPIGDVANGEIIYSGALGCFGCHTAGLIAPFTAGTATRATDRIASDPLLEGYTLGQYLIESVVSPDAYVVAPEGDQAYAVMPVDFGDRITLDDLADLVAYLETQTE